MRGRGGSVPLPVWAMTGALFLGILLFARALPGAKTAEAARYFNVERLDRFRAAAPPRPPRVVVVGSSLSMCALPFDGELEQFARENGLPDLVFVRFIKLDAALRDFTPLLDFILQADPDVVFFESRMFVLSSRGERGEGRRRPLFFRDDANDDRKKLQAFLRGLIWKNQPPPKKENPNVPGSEQKVLLAIRERQSQDAFEHIREAAEERLSIRPFSVPDEYKTFFDALRRKHIIGVLLDFPRSRMFESAISPEVVSAMPGRIKRYEDAYGLRSMAYPGRLGLDHFKDFTHLNARGSAAYSRWFLSELPALLAAGKTS